MDWVSGVALGAALGCGLMAGVFFAFSAFVMKALGRLPAEPGADAMRAINVAAPRSSFLAVFLGTAVACAVLGVAGWARLGEGGAGALVAGSLLYLVGSFGVTLACNVPLNDALAAGRAAGVWEGYAGRWTLWNHVRTAAALAAAAVFILAR